MAQPLPRPFELIRFPTFQEELPGKHGDKKTAQQSLRSILAKNPITTLCRTTSPTSTSPTTISSSTDSNSNSVSNSGTIDSSHLDSTGTTRLSSSGGEAQPRSATARTSPADYRWITSKDKTKSCRDSVSSLGSTASRRSSGDSKKSSNSSKERSAGDT